MNFSNSSVQFPTKNIEIAFKVCNFLFARHSPPVSTWRGGWKMPELQISEISQTSSPSFYSPLPIFAHLPRPTKKLIISYVLIPITRRERFFWGRGFLWSDGHTLTNSGVSADRLRKTWIGKKENLLRGLIFQKVQALFHKYFVFIQQNEEIKVYFGKLKMHKSFNTSSI